MRYRTFFSLITTIALMVFISNLTSKMANAFLPASSTNGILIFQQEEQKEDEKKEDEKKDEKEEEGKGGTGTKKGTTTGIDKEKGDGPTKPGSKGAVGGDGDGAGTRAAGTNKIGDGKGDGPAKPGSKGAVGGGNGDGAGTRAAGTNKIGGGDADGPAKPGAKGAVGGGEGDGAGTRAAGTNKIGDGKGDGPAMPGSKGAAGGGNGDGAGTRAAGTNKIGGGESEGPARPGAKGAAGGGNGEGAGTRAAGTNKIGGGESEGPARPGAKGAAGGGNGEGAGTRAAGTNKIGGGEGDGPTMPGAKGAAGGGNSGAGTRAAGTNKIGDGEGDGPARPGARSATGGSGAGSRSAGANRIGGESGSRNSGRSNSPTVNSRNVDPAQPVENQNWYDMAVYSFENGQESNAFRYLYGHVLAEKNGFDSEMGWVSGIREPRVATRWGVGIEIDAANNFTGDPPLVGEVPVLPNNRRQQSGPEPGSTPYKDVDKESVRGNFIYYTGELGERLLQQLDQRRQDQGAWGALLKEMPGEGVEVSELPSGDGAAAGNSGPRNGAVASMRGVPQAGARGNNDAAQSFPSKSGTLIPGVMHLGVGSSSEILESAASEGIDVVVIFEVELSVNPRVGTRYNKTRMKLIRVKDGEVLRNGGSIDYIKVWQKRDRSRNSSGDPIVAEFDKMFAVVDEGDSRLIKSQMPNLSDEIAKQRVEHLAATSEGSELVRLVEIAKYYRSGLISKTFAIEQVSKMVGADKAEALFSGDETERKTALLQMMPGGEG